jgi:hypothetical protein
MKASSKAHNKGQSKAFIEKARELGCEEDEAAFKERLRKIASAPAPVAKPQPKSPKKKPRRTGGT